MLCAKEYLPICVLTYLALSKCYSSFKAANTKRLQGRCWCLNGLTRLKTRSVASKHDEGRGSMIGSLARSLKGTDLRIIV